GWRLRCRRRPRRTPPLFRPPWRGSFPAEPRSRRRSPRCVSARAWHTWRTARRRSASGSSRRGSAARRPWCELTAPPARRCGAAFRGAGALWSRRAGVPAPRRYGGQAPAAAYGAPPSLRVAEAGRFAAASSRGREGRQLALDVGRAHDVLVHSQLLRREAERKADELREVQDRQSEIAADGGGGVRLLQVEVQVAQRARSDERVRTLVDRVADVAAGLLQG